MCTLYLGRRRGHFQPFRFHTLLACNGAGRNEEIRAFVWKGREKIIVSSQCVYKDRTWGEIGFSPVWLTLWERCVYLCVCDEVSDYLLFAHYCHYYTVAHYVHTCSRKVSLLACHPVVVRAGDIETSRKFLMPRGKWKFDTIREPADPFSIIFSHWGRHFLSCSYSSSSYVWTIFSFPKCQIEMSLQ